ncbi:MAG: arylsulfotransferase family protein [Geminicoccaceae bacterium]
MERAAKLLFVVGLVILAVLYGYFARSREMFPHRQLKAASDALFAVVNVYFESDTMLVPAKGDKGGVVQLDAALAAPGATLLPLYDGKQFGARLVDLEGRTLHEWHAKFTDVWGTSPSHVRAVGDNSTINWHGTHLYPNGDLLFNFAGQLFPFGGGLIKIDKDSKVVWKLARNTHHDVQVAADGTIWVPALHYRADGMPELPGYQPWFYEDTVLKVSPDGEVQDEISMLLAARSLPGLMPVRTDDFDPTHLNAIEVVTPEIAATWPMLTVGDIVVSLRNVNTVMAIDKASKNATWMMQGPFRRQHDPDLLPNGHMLVFDNLGGNPACGRSRVLELDPITYAHVWQYDGCIGKERFESEAWGGLQPLPNGNVLVTSSFEGRVFEVTHEATPRIVWEYRNLVGTRDGKPMAGLIGEAHRFAPGELTFLAQPAG